MPPLPTPASVHTNVPTSISSSRLYPELIDMVIDHCYGDASALQACSLVCRDWLPSARFHAFSQIKLTSHNHVPFPHLLTHPHSTLPYSVLGLELVQDINNEREWLNQVIPELAHLLPRIRSLTVVLGETKLSRKTRDALRMGFTGLKEVKLKEASFRTFREFQDVICGFPKLERVLLEGSWSRMGYGAGITPNADSVFSWPLQATIPSNHHFAFATGYGCDMVCLPAHPHLHLPPPLPPRPVRTLTKLELTTCPTQDVLNWFLSLDPIPLVHILHLGHIIPEEISAISRYLTTCGDRLEELGLQPERQVQDILSQQLDLGLNTSLHTLIIDLSFCHQTLDIGLIAQILFQVSRTSLRSVTIILGPAILSLQNNHWVHIDEALSTFPYLARVIILSKILPSDHCTIGGPILRRCAERGILHIGKQESSLF